MSCQGCSRGRSSPAPAREGRAADFVGALRVGATLVEDVSGTEAITRDPKDDYLVRLARASAAVALVSGNRDLLEADIDTRRPSRPDPQDAYHIAAAVFDPVLAGENTT